MAYIEVLEGKARYERKSSFKTWLFGIIRRIAAGERRRSWWSALRLERFKRLVPTRAADLPDAGLMARREAARLVEALARLSARQQEVLHLVFYQEMSLSEAAGVLGLRIGTARAHYERGKRRLRALLQGEVSR